MIPLQIMEKSLEACSVTKNVREVIGFLHRDAYESAVKGKPFDVRELRAKLEMLSTVLLVLEADTQEVDDFLKEKAA